MILGRKRVMIGWGAGRGEDDWTATLWGGAAENEWGGRGWVSWREREGLGPDGGEGTGADGRGVWGCLGCGGGSGGGGGDDVYIYMTGYSLVCVLACIFLRFILSCLCYFSCQLHRALTLRNLQLSHSPAKQTTALSEPFWTQLELLCSK